VEVSIAPRETMILEID